MMWWIGYGLAAVIFLVKFFPVALKSVIEENDVDEFDMAQLLVTSVAISAMWPLCVGIWVINRLLLKPIVNELNRKNAGGK